MKMRFLLALLPSLTLQAFAESKEGYPDNTTFKAYAKRDRVLVGGLQTNAASQLHEIAGSRASAGGEYNATRIKSDTNKVDLSRPSGTFELAYGTEHLTLDLAGSYLQGDANANVGVDETFESKKLIPQVAYTLKYFTVSVGTELNWLDATESETHESTYHFNTQRVMGALAYHDPRFEAGIALNSASSDTDELDAGVEKEATLSLAAPRDQSRSVYLPAEASIYARGNFTDSFSLLGQVTGSRYEGNKAGAIELFDNYNGKDRLASKLVATYWTPMRSRISLAGEYKGAATTAIGSDEAGLGYRLANLYGGSIEGVLSLNRKVYLGALAGFLRGERSDEHKNVAYKGSEESQRYAATAAVKF